VEPSFNIEEVSELIARLMPGLKGDAAGFVTHHEIVSGVLADVRGVSIVSRARNAKPDAWLDDRSAAANMVAWFSQQVTTGVSRWAAYFDREKRGDVWAYRPKNADPNRWPSILRHWLPSRAIRGGSSTFSESAIPRSQRRSELRRGCQMGGWRARPAVSRRVTRIPASTVIYVRSTIANRCRRRLRRSLPRSQTWR
jgi:hypothetical protein